MIKKLMIAVAAIAIGSTVMITEASAGGGGGSGTGGAFDGAHGFSGTQSDSSSSGSAYMSSGRSFQRFRNGRSLGGDASRRYYDYADCYRYRGRLVCK